MYIHTNIHKYIDGKKHSVCIFIFASIILKHPAYEKNRTLLIGVDFFYFKMKRIKYLR